MSSTSIAMEIQCCAVQHHYIVVFWMVANVVLIID